MLTPEQLELKKKIDEAEAALRPAQEAFLALMRQCKHVIAEPDRRSIRDGCAGAQCAVCKLNLGWYCPDSPDHACHYYSHDGKVTLVDGTEVDVPEKVKGRTESDDWCIFCEEPDERK